MTARFGLTTRAVELLAVIKAHVKQHGCPPTYDQMAKELGVKRGGTIDRLLGQLEDRGHIRRLFHRRQSLEVIERRTLALPAKLYARLEADARACGWSMEKHLEMLLDLHIPFDRPVSR